MDNHLNLFYSYAQGRLDSDIDSENALEDNITRAFIITLQENPELTKSILEKYFTFTKLSNKINFNYDLQNIDTESIEKISNFKKKIIFGISTIEEDKKHITKDNLLDFKENKHVERIVDWFDKNYVLSKLDTQSSKKAFNEIKLFKIQLKECIDDVKKSKKDGLNEKELNLGYENRKIIDATRKIFYDNEKKNRFDSLIVEKFDWVTLDILKYLNDVSNGSRPDAWIWTENGQSDFVILIENKINGGLYGEQIIRHIKNENGLYSNIESVDISILTWKELYKDLKDFHEKNDFLNPISKFLLTSFIKYIELNNMGDFIGFKQADFLLIDRSQTWKRMKKLLDYTLQEKFLKEDFEKYFIAQENDELFKFQKSVGGLKVYLGRENIQNYAHYTFYLGKDGFSIKISFPSKKDPHKKLVEKISSNIDYFKKLIASQEYSYDFKIHSKYGKLNRTGKYAPTTDQIFPLYCSYLTKFIEKDYYTFDSNDYDFKTIKTELKYDQDYYNYWVGNLFEEVKKINNPFIVIEKNFSISYIVNKGKDFEEICYKVFKDLLPIYEFANK